MSLTDQLKFARCNAAELSVVDGLVLPNEETIATPITSVKQFLASLPAGVGAGKYSDPIEYEIGMIAQGPIRRSDADSKAGIFGARKYRRALKTLVRCDQAEVLKGEPLPTPTRLLSKRLRQIRLGYTPSPRKRSSGARGRKAALMMVFGAKLGRCR